MAIRDKNRGGTPGQGTQELTDRENELAIFQRLLDEPAHLPALMFYGVSGTGKSWLLKRLRNELTERSLLPSAYVDFDRQSGGPSYVSDFSNLLAEVWRQLDIECPRFETAYSWMRFKQGASDRPLIRHSGGVSTGWDFVKEVANAGFSWVPGINLIVWAADKLGKAIVSKIQETSLGKHLLTKAGNGRSLYPKGLRRRWPYRKPLRPFGYRLLNEAASRWADCLPPMEIGRRDRLPVDPRGMASGGSGIASLS